VVITSDHGEEFRDQETAYWGHGSNFTKYQIGVPLVISWPGKQGQVAYRTSHEDVSLTLVNNALNCGLDPSDISTGTNLFDKGDRVNIIESYVNQGIVVNDVVTELYPGFVKTYSVSNVDEERDTPPEALQGVQRIYSQFR
jgi:membrane-anchored protein YejM (alkaline phosphatase superfamily)